MVYLLDSLLHFLRSAYTTGSPPLPELKQASILSSSATHAAYLAAVSSSGTSCGNNSGCGFLHGASSPAGSLVQMCSQRDPSDANLAQLRTVCSELCSSVSVCTTCLVALLIPRVA